LFVNETTATIRGFVNRLRGLRAVQWHGERPPLPTEMPCNLVTAFAVGNADDLGAVGRYLDQCRDANALPAAILLDGQTRGLYGGTGRQAPWELLADFRPGVDIILAGGLTPENVAEAIRIVRPYGVDVAGGVESSPGKKDADAMRRFIDQAREAAARW
jgi:phosphoribosylanthranilate isomerase